MLSIEYEKYRKTKVNDRLTDRWYLADFYVTQLR